MSEGQSSRGHHPDTHEFDAVRSPEGHQERKEFELVGNYRVSVREDFQHPIELRVGRDARTPTCYLIRNPSHFSREGAYAIVQPEVVREHPGRGWVAFGGGVRGLVKIGRQASPQFELGPDVSRMHCLVAEHADDPNDNLEIENYGRNGMRVLVHPDDLAGEVEEFTPGAEDADPEY